MIFEQENAIQQQLLQNEKMLQEQIEQLGLKVNNGQEFQIDKKQIYVILNRLLSYPSTKQAQIHRKANQLGILDIQRQKIYNRISENDHSQNVQTFIKNQQQFCSCCGFILQEKQLDVCSHKLQEIKNLGISTYVFFRTIINATYLLTIMFIIYSIYSISTNLVSSKMQTNGNNSEAALNFLSISLGSKELFASDQKRFLYVVGAWIGAAMLVVWAFAIIALKYYQKETQIKLLMQTKTASQYSLVIQKMPTDMTQQQVQQQFNNYLERLKEMQDIEIEKLQIEKYNEGKPFYLHQQEFKSKQLNEILNLCERYKYKFGQWILQRRFRDTFKMADQKRQEVYKKYQSILDKKNMLCEQIIQEMKQQYKKNNKSNKTTVFITFSNNYQKNFILQNNPSDVFSILKEFVPFLKSQKRFTIERNGVKHNLKIYPAPDPEDIIWSNIGVRNCEKISRKILTYSITLLILAISFVIVYGLTTLQAQQGINIYISIIISLSISIVNILIIQVIKYLSTLQRDYTMTNLQVSLAIKSIVAQLINCIFVPIAANRFIKKNIYNRNGLVQDIFILAITNSFVPPLMKIIDPYYYIVKMYGYFKKDPRQKLSINQSQLNEIFEKPEFQVGYEYIYIINLFIFTCYFVSLQPIIPIFSILGYIFMYFAQKYSIYKRCQRPVPGTRIINTTMSQILYFGPIAYTLGSFTWSSFLSDKQFAYSIPPNMLALSISIVIFVFPYESFFRKIFKHKRMPQVFYNDNRIFFTSQYDRLNPSTFQSGIKDYKRFLQKIKKKLQTQKPQIKTKLNIDLEHNIRPNFLRQSGTNFFLKDNNQLIYNNLLKKQTLNIVTPQMVAGYLYPSQKNNKFLYKTNHRRKIPSPKFKQQHSHIYPINNKIKEYGLEGQYTENRHQKMINNVENAVSIHLGKTQYPIIPEKPMDNSIVNKYLEGIPFANSHIMNISKSRGKQQQISKQVDLSHQLKTNNQKRKKSIHEPNQISREFKKQHTSEIVLKIRHNKVQNQNSGFQGLQSLNLGKKFSYRQSMVKSLCSSIKNKEDAFGTINRFSINVQNIFPLSLKQQSKQVDFLPGESQVKFYEISKFQ